MGFLEEESARRRLQTYLHDLEEERTKIQVFQRELPLCFELVSRTIEGCRQQLVAGGELVGHGRRDWDDDTSSDGPVFEEFIPIKRSREDGEEEDNDRHRRRSRDEEEVEEEKPSKKPDWMKSVQLWTSAQPQAASTPAQEDMSARVKPIVVEPKRPNGAFQPFQREKRDAVAAAPAASVHQPAGAVVSVAPLPRHPQLACAASSTGDTGGSSKGIGPGAGTAGGGECDDKEGQSSQRKVRRCWSPELHGRFLEALKQLGGAHVATPKQIRELMKEEGLTNDEVKSHLQKYRLHTRRSSPPAAEANSGRGGGGASHQQQQQLILVGGLWAQPVSQYAPVTPAPAAAEKQLLSNGHHHNLLLSKSKACDRGESSPATSTSSHTITSH